MKWYEVIARTRNGGAIIGNTYSDGFVHLEENSVRYVSPDRFRRAKVRHDNNRILIGLG